jgi:ASPIC/UnbV protein/VCBS repeat protein
MFEPVTAGRSGIDFNNKIVENDSINPIDLTNIYNGGGVGVGDFNNDGLQDLYFTAGLVSNKLYLNKGELTFNDITVSAGVTGDGKWCRGVAVIDINNDGWMDMYVCASMSTDANRRKNLLYINQGLDKDRLPFFKEQAAAYGLDDTTHTTMASFFDYDNDGDLDVYLVVNQILKNVNPSIFKEKIIDGSFPSTGRLYQNAMDSSKQHPVFTDVSKQAGITGEGYGHGATIADINRDGWKDIFISNDFIANDLLYINNHDGTFTDKAASYFKHTSANWMGQDIIDINNDGLSDIIELDMNPEDNYRKKMMMNPGSYQTYQLNDFFKYQHQYVRNTLQLNMGPRMNGNDSIGDPVFADVAYAAGVAETDWSWAPLAADFDNDGFRDLVITNGFPKDITDHDFIAYRKQATFTGSESSTLSQIPEVKLHNYAFRNRGNHSGEAAFNRSKNAGFAGFAGFEDVSLRWGLKAPSFSNGAAYADLDNDGDLDFVVNNINDPASLYENLTMNVSDSKAAGNKHYLAVQLSGDRQNRNGLGSWIEIYYGGQQQAYEQTPYRGYLSTIQLNPHFGLDTMSSIDSLIVFWPAGKKQVVKNVKADQTIKIDIKDALEGFTMQVPAIAVNNLFTDITAASGIRYIHTQPDQIDFNIQRLLPHKFSEYGPSIAAADINGDGLDDMVVGGNSTLSATCLIQQANGTFAEKPIPVPGSMQGLSFLDMGVLLFDADGDGDVDLHVARGGYESKVNAPAYQDAFYVNDGKGNFTYDSLALPQNLTSKSCVRAVDFDRDGDLDLFIAGRVEPWSYPRAVSSFIYRNDSELGSGDTSGTLAPKRAITKSGHKAPRKIHFTDVTARVAPVLKNIGLVCDALFTDFDNDGLVDLLLAGEFMPLTFLKNVNGVFADVTPATGVASQTGWWNSISGGDFDNDGDIDYVLGNLGSNSYFKADSAHPVSVYAKDFDNNSSYDAFLSLYLSTSQDTSDKREYPASLRDDAISQMTGMKSKFRNYRSYATATMDKLLTGEQLTGALHLKANNFASAFCRNDGAGKFTLIPLPAVAQLSPLNGMVVDDFDGDANLDIMINANDYGADVSIGRYDAMSGLLLQGDGKGNFAPASILQSGIYIPGNGKALVKLRGKNGKYLVAASQNRGPLKLFSLKTVITVPAATRTFDGSGVSFVGASPDDIRTEVIYKDGRRQLSELYYGASFLSQSARFIKVHNDAASITFTDSKGSKRQVLLPAQIAKTSAMQR